MERRTLHTSFDGSPLDFVQDSNSPGPTQRAQPSPTSPTNKEPSRSSITTLVMVRSPSESPMMRKPATEPTASPPSVGIKIFP